MTISSANGPETGLPGWTYEDPDFFALERKAVFQPSWQMVCHESDIEARGQYATLNFMGALIAVIRGEDGIARAFRNICRHRAARLLDDPFGQCSSRIVCPYHAWTYDLRGRLVGLPERDTYEPFENEDYGLIPLELREAGGFLFVNLGGADQSFDDFIAPMREDFEIYRTKDMRALGRITLRERAVNWKIAIENYVDYMHLPFAHEGLNGLVGKGYALHADGDAILITSDVEETPSQTLSARAYRKILPTADYLPENRQRHWRYIKLWPNLAFDIYPDQLDFMQFIPLAPGRTLLREMPYALPDERREMKAARYLNWRVNRIVNLEDRDVIERTQAGFEDGAVPPGPISTREIGLRHFAEKMRDLLPICRESDRPAAERLRSA